MIVSPWSKNYHVLTHDDHITLVNNYNDLTSSDKFTRYEKREIQKKIKLPNGQGERAKQ